MVQVRIQVIGLVQGVWFRAYTRDQAIELNLFGWVCNDRDGSVRIVAAGVKDHIDQFIGRVKTGSPQSRVDSVHVVDEPVTEHKAFVIRR